MFKCVILCLCVDLSVILCAKVGDECEWEGLDGTCVKRTKCMTTLDKKSPKHPKCSRSKNLICCTDCQLVNDTRKAVITPTSGVYWKTGQKARDNCLQYIKQLPYPCKTEGFRAGIKRELNDDETCYVFKEWAKDGEVIHKDAYDYPLQVLLGYGSGQKSHDWNARGVLISDKYVLTAAHSEKLKGQELELVSLRGRILRLLNIKRFIPHPEYKPPSLYHDIALIELDQSVEFKDNVLPACLHVDDNISIKDTVTTLGVHFEEFTKEECKAGVGKPSFLDRGYDHTTQLCYGSKTNKTNPSNVCGGLPGQPMMVERQFSSCVYTVIGLFSFGPRKCGAESTKPGAYITRVAPYVPWIESIVWP